MQKLLTVIPFEGFYETCSGFAIENTIERDADFYREQLDQDAAARLIAPEIVKEVKALIAAFPGADLFGDLASNFFEKADIRTAQRVVAREWCGNIEACYRDEYGVSLSIDLDDLMIKSPREYNFYTDQLLAPVSVDALQKLLWDYRIQIYSYVREELAPRDGFIPGYSNSVDEWGSYVYEWTPAQLGLILSPLMTDAIEEGLKEGSCECCIDVEYTEEPEQILLRTAREAAEKYREEAV